VPWRIDSAYTIHHETKIPSWFSTIKAGSGPGDESISSPGRGRGTFSFADKSKAVPMGEVLAKSKSSAIGSIARRESLAMVVVVKTLVTCSGGRSLERGAVDREKRPTSSEAVDATSMRSCKPGGKSFSLCMKWLGGDRLSPNGAHTSGSFWKMTEFWVGCREMRWKMLAGGFSAS